MSLHDVEVTALADPATKPRPVINAAEVYDITLLVPTLLWSGTFTRDTDPGLAECIDAVVTYLKNRK